MDELKCRSMSDDYLESSAKLTDSRSATENDHSTTDIKSEAIQCDPFEKESLVTPSIVVDDVNPTLVCPRNLLSGDRPSQPRHPSGMLMGPDDPFFQEVSHNSRNPVMGSVRYDVIGPFGQEPDPDIDHPGLRTRLPQYRNDFKPPNGGMFGGCGGPFGGFI